MTATAPAAPAAATTGAREAADEAAFATSGHTGEPVTWRRPRDLLDYEAALVADTLIGPVDYIINFAPVHHMYGHLFGEILPRLRGAEVHQAWHRDPTDVPPLREGARTLLVCLPSSWPLLRHLVPALRDLPGVVALHSSAAPTDAAREVVAGLHDRGFRAESLLGATETGAVAHRPIEPAGAPGTTPWRLLPDVYLVPDRGDDAGADYLHVASPRIARGPGMSQAPHSWRLTDLIRRRGPRTFDHLGRASRLVKVNGRRVWLDHVENAVRGALPGADAACLPVNDDVRGEHYELYVSAPADPAGPGGPPDGARLVRESLTAALPGVPGPRAVRFVPRIPRTDTGKVRLPALRCLADQTHAAHA